MTQIITSRWGWQWWGGGWDWDMKKSVYDPTNVNWDAFDYDNFHNTPTIPTSSDYVDLTTSQSVGWTKTFTTSPVVPAKSTDAANLDTAIATEAQVYKKQDKLTAQTAYTSKWTASKVPQITTNTLWQVTWITEVNISYPSQVDNTAYAASWDWVTTTAPSKNAVYDKISAMDTTIGSKANDSDVVKLTWNQTIAWTKTFSTSPVVPSKTTTATNTGTAIATEAQVYSVKSAVDLLSWLWKFLSLWDSSTWQPISFPLSTPYTYTTWDWFMVETVSTANPPVNYMPNWSSYTWAASTTVDTTNNVEQRDVYIYDWTNWLFQKNNEVQVSFSDIAWNATDNASLSTALNAKQNTLTTQTAYTSKWTSTKVPTITTNTLWQVTTITETSIAFPVSSVNGNTWTVTVSEFTPSWTATNGYVVTKTADWYEWAAPSWDVVVSSQSWNILTSWMKIWAGTQANYEALWSYDNNTVYLTI